MKEEKWLLRKSSGSKSKYKVKGDYSDDRVADLNLLNELPLRESVKTSKSFLDTGLVKKWLNNYVDQDFDFIYSEFIKRIQPKYLNEYKECIFWYAEPRANVSFDEEGNVYGAWNGKPVKLPNSQSSTFYVDPATNLLKRIPEHQFKREKITYKDY
ncbi:hypothetical protein FA048_03680 [Pedobacter polaris]|uniref:Uncharacterized protein n=1 Tax=Pedobacter polaris TaxID=2571273 RepID=A0A4U1CWS6_9SPHI|nr:hypothetical protein [Pedobacter polaris]TKC12730.1 hypothetical protein FA048_03680 [Pedobacter polaris]